MRGTLLRAVATSLLGAALVGGLAVTASAAPSAGTASRVSVTDAPWRELGPCNGMAIWCME